MTESEGIALKVRVAELERHVAFLASHLGLELGESESDAHPEVLALIRKGDKLGAIAKLRALVGCSLAEAKARVEALGG